MGEFLQKTKLRRVVENLLIGPKAADHVVALTDVYTGNTSSGLPERSRCDSEDAFLGWSGTAVSPSRCSVRLRSLAPSLLANHSATRTTQSRSARRQSRDGETIHVPPAYRIQEVFEAGGCRDSYIKPRDAGRILRENDLAVAIGQCSELKKFVNTFLTLAGGEALP